MHSIPSNRGKKHRRTQALRSVAVFLFLSTWGTTDATFAATVPVPYELATWRGFRASAVSYTFDDNSPKQFSVAQPMFDAKGLPATFFCIVGDLSASQWETIENASSKGHEIGSHTLTHPDLTTLSNDDLTAQLFGSQEVIESHTGEKCVSVAYPYCTVPDKSVTSEFYAFARSCNGALVPSTPTDFLSIGAMGPDGDMNAKADNAASSGSWLVWLLHGIDDDPACCPIASTALQSNLDHVTATPDKWWVETFGNVSCYIQERDAAVLTVVSSGATSITLRLTHGLDTTIFDYPLTLRRPMPSGWAAATVTQDGALVECRVVDGKLMFDAVPNGGDIVLAKTDPPQGQSDIGADNPNIQYVGRFDRTISSAPGFDWSHSTIRAKFQGTSCSVKMEGPGKYFDVFIDGAKTSPIISSTGGLETFLVASGLSDGIHRISLCRRAEASLGKNTFRGFILDGGKTLVAPDPAPSRKMAFIGDSYTCGYGVEGEFSDTFYFSTENACLTYASHMASHYNAECMITAWSGKGMVRNYGDSNQTSVDPFPPVFPRTCGTVANNDYDFAWQPDVVVVALGINDFSTTPHPSEEQYVGGYLSFIETLRSHYPDAHIICTYLSSMDSVASGYIAAAASASGDSKVHFASVSYNLVVPDDFGPHYHPNIVGQAKIADAFIPVFDSIMGTTWGGDTDPDPDPPVMDKMIYQDNLDPAWVSWSWATVDMASTFQVRRGSSAIAVTAGAWEALYLRRSSLQDTTGYSAVAFWVHGGESGGQPLQVISVRDGEAVGSTPIPSPFAGVWTRVVIHLSELGLANVPDFNGLMIQNASGSPISTFHVEDVALVGGADADDWVSQDWESWRESRFSASELADDGIGGPGADPDHDGVPNRVEWWLLRDPFVNEGNPWCSWQLADGAVALSYDRRGGFPTDMTLETSIDMNDWHSAVGTSRVQPLDASGLSERVSWTIPATEQKLFLRLN